MKNQKKALPRKTSNYKATAMTQHQSGCQRLEVPPSAIEIFDVRLKVCHGFVRTPDSLKHHQALSLGGNTSNWISR
jgi:hypothetical protein